MYLGENIKKLGFGLMRLPQKEGGGIDIEQVKLMVSRFLEAGFTYFDTAWAYAGSEEAINEALIKRYPRESFQLATKNAAWINCKTRLEAAEQLNVSLERTGTGYFDFYLLHNLGESRTAAFDRLDMWSFVQEKKKEGVLKHVGFSFHSTAEELDAILTAHPEMEFVQLQINYADWDSPSIQSRACYETARRHGKPVIIMEPVKGGMLATPPQPVMDIFKKADSKASAASWAIRYAADLEGVITVLSGMSNMEQMEDNISFMKDFVSLTAGERQVIAKAQEAMKNIPLIPCTACNYCAKVCPKNIGISDTFTAMNYLTLYDNISSAKHQEEWLVGGHGMNNAAKCIKCGKCEQVCPQHIAIRSELSKAVKTLGLN